MSAFDFLKNPVSKKWTILAPRRAKRPDVALGTEPICPFCPQNLIEKELLKVDGENGVWLIKVVPNKFPFAPIHELVIETPLHQKGMETFSKEHMQKVIGVYKHRYNEHSKDGQVFIFHNHGQKAGESIPHSHTQVAVFPEKVFLDIPLLTSVESDVLGGLKTTQFTVFCPKTSAWPDEVWVSPKAGKKAFGEINDAQITDLSHILMQLISMYDIRYNNDFPYNFYIHPGTDWYLRLIPRNKVLGGVEVGTGVFINTQDPEETMTFIKEHFEAIDEAKIKEVHQAEYSLRT